MLKIKKILIAPYRAFKTLLRWYGVVPVVAVLTVLFVSGAVVAYNTIKNTQTTDDTSLTQDKTVVITTAEAFMTDFSGTLIGTAVAKTEATLLTERGGQVTSVSVSLGQSVAAGTILAQFSNDSERAALTQARGAYESALASAQQSAISITDATNSLADSKRALVTAHNNAQATVTGILTGSIDVFFANPNNQIPGLRVNGGSNTSNLNNLRVTLREQLAVWQQNTASLTVENDPAQEVTLARNTIENTITMVNMFIAIFQQEQGDTQYSQAEYRDFLTSFTQIRTTLTGLLNSIATAESNVATALENVDRARLSGGDISSLASAQVTQARGSLQAAEANFNKTIIRTPISGTVATLAVRPGDYTSPQSLVAKITNTDGVEITTYISESEKMYFMVGDSVVVNDMATGTISAISPAIDNSTQKFEMRIAVNDVSISPGSTVSIALPKATTVDTDIKKAIIIPITAIKFTNTDGAVFIVENDTLVAKPVTLGPINDSMVTVTDGITHDTKFVLDARGKIAGEKVTVTHQ